MPRTRRPRLANAPTIRINTPDPERLAMALLRIRSELRIVIGEQVPGSVTDRAARAALRATVAAARFSGQPFPEESLEQIESIAP